MLLARSGVLYFNPPLMKLETVPRGQVVLFEFRLQYRRLLLLPLLAVLDGLTNRARVFAVEGLSNAGFQPGLLAVLDNHANPGARLQQRPVTLRAVRWLRT